ncbi:MAG TPA: lytic transglycosylase domain-containing protein [Puia sp.]|nr:lytic transglycosylase domain-containing protein [Puia sp.]
MRQVELRVLLLRGLVISFSFLFFLPFSTSSETFKNVDAQSSNKMYLDKRAREFVKNYIEYNREKLLDIKQRSHRPFAIADSVFNQYSLPVQLKYLAVIESELNVNAVSKVGAVGAWQLMPKTAQLLGLRITDECDERTRFDKSTRAAAMYLKDLYSEFGDWLLVLAAYNAGPGSVHRAMRLAGSRNFWDLQYYLPMESRLHVKKFVASLYYFEG